MWRGVLKIYTLHFWMGWVITKSLFQMSLNLYLDVRKNFSSYEKGKVLLSVWLLLWELRLGGGERRKTRGKLRRGKGKSRRNKSGEEEIKRKKCSISLHVVPGALPGIQASRCWLKWAPLSWPCTLPYHVQVSGSQIMISGKLHIIKKY